MIVAGEASGDLYGAGFVRSLKKRIPELKVSGMGGDRMKAEGVEILSDIKEVSVVGITEVISNLGRIKKALSLLKNRLAKERPDALILIDFPDFNLRLAKKAKAVGIPVIYYISPQVWAWRSDRVKKIARLVDKMLVAFPFEVDIYRKEGLDTEFVGHPLLDEFTPPSPPLSKGRMGGVSPLARGDTGELKEGLKEEGMKRYGLDQGRPVLALLPGSRKREVEVHLPVMLETLDLLKLSGIQAIIPVAHTVDFSMVKDMVKGYDVVLTREDVPEVFRISDAAVITSGTATLQAAISGVPMVVIYRVSPITYLLAKILVKVKNIAIVNIIAGRDVVPELTQSDVTPEKIAGVIRKILDDPLCMDNMKRDLRGVREKLGDPGASDRAAEAVMGLLERK